MLCPYNGVAVYHKQQAAITLFAYCSCSAGMAHIYLAHDVYVIICPVHTSLMLYQHAPVALRLCQTMFMPQRAYTMPCVCTTPCPGPPLHMSAAGDAQRPLHDTWQMPGSLALLMLLARMLTMMSMSLKMILLLGLLLMALMWRMLAHSCVRF